MEVANANTPRLLVATVVDARDELEEKLERCNQFVKQLTNNLSETEAHDALVTNIGREPRCHDDVCQGLMYATLLEPQSAEKHYRDLTLITRDGLQCVVNGLVLITAEKFPKLTDVALRQLLWFSREMIRNTVTGVETLCWNILRNISGGDVSPRNLVVTEYMLDVFIQNRSWLDKYPFTVATVVYTYLRLIDDHGGNHTQTLAALRQKEVTFCVTLLRERFNDCLVIGRDLVRLLQTVARIPEFESLWRDLYENPRIFSPNLTGVQQLMQVRTSRRFLQCRLTPDMERKIVFLTSNVRFGNHKRYQDWFHKQYLNTPESQSLRCDLIRFIVGVIHPTNELLGSDIIPRWAVIGWLLSTCTSSVAASNAKLALFYDWLFFDPEKDSIMNIEPAILVMHHSLRGHAAITSTLLDFLVKIIPNFYPAYCDRVQAGVFASLSTILKKRVLQNLNPIFENHMLDNNLRNVVKEKFKDFFTPDGADKEVVMLDAEPVPVNNHNVDEPMFSDDEEDVPLAAKVKSRKCEKEGIDIDDIIASVDDMLRVHLENLQTKIKEKQCEAMDKLMNLIVSKGVDEDDIRAVATCILSIFESEFKGNPFPEDYNDDLIKASIETPVFAMFRALAFAVDSTKSTDSLLSIFQEMSAKEEKLGYLLLYYLKANNLDGFKTMSSVSAVYKEFYKDSKAPLIENLLKDMRLCQDNDKFLFVWLVPEVYQLFPQLTQNNTELLHLLLEVVDANQMQLLICLVLQNKLVIFDNETLLPVLHDSLNWETFEQCCFWHLIEAHNIPLDDIIAILPDLDFAKHAEALTSVMLFLKQERPTADLLKNILGRTAKATDFFVVSILQYWIQDYEDRVADLVSSLLKQLTSNSPSKRKRGGQAAGPAKGPRQPTIEQVLAHLDQLRIVSKHNPKFFLLDSMQRALQHVLATSLDPLKKKFHDLLALAEELQPRGSGTGGRGTRKAATTAKRENNRTVRTATVAPDTDTSEVSSEEEEVIKPKQVKKRKKAILVESD